MAAMLTPTIASIVLLISFIGVDCANVCKNSTLSASGTGKFITSPGYPNNYANNMSCQWHISAASSSQVVVLKLLDFYLEGLYPFWCIDYVHIYDGSNTSSPRIKTLCDHYIFDHKYVSSGPSMTVVFHSDSSDNFKGFKLEYTSQEKSALCAGTTLTAGSTSKYLYSPNYPEVYPRNMDCQWKLSTGSKSNTVVLILMQLQLGEYYSTCSTSDYVKIYDGPSTSSPELRTLCGIKYVERFESSGTDLTVVFHSVGGSTYYEGFRFIYYSTSSAGLLTTAQMSFLPLILTLFQFFY
jgi:cubilin